ncbi:SIR2 family protein [Paenibacillus assamensis]|uniref:SIR2 family protein n=1 Tax=Paenibacillus assamensis TaxID=311244 RepID=UPI00041360AC|nr:SIR2 family protein [Paenibacillus assamensis]
MDKINRYVKEIIEASKSGKLVFFVGAGLSTLSNYPQWWQLVNRYYEQLYGKTKEGSYSSDDYLRIPQMFYDVCGEKDYDRILENVFSVEKETNQIHDKMIALNPVHIITTNYDNLIERACGKRGKYFSVISGDEDIARATSSRYLLKVHGDFSRGFKGANVVLKESDYINYEQNFPLISNLMKTIMATHTIVFIGYGLGDYNIKMLMNWVKKLQNDSYKEPVLIRTEYEPLEENEEVYFEKKGLRIIDAASLIQSDKMEYLQRYDAVMNRLIESRDNSLISCDDDVIEFIYLKLNPLFTMKKLRKLDLKYVFDYDYHFEVCGRVICHNNNGFGYMERYFEIKDNNGHLSSSLKAKLSEINLFFERTGITSMLNSSNSASIRPFEIDSLVYHNNFEEMKNFIKSPSFNLEHKYKKAYFLAYLGNVVEAYNYYSEVILDSINKLDWYLHYLAQINRFRLYQSIKHRSRYDYNNNLFSKDFISQIDREMKNFNIDNVFSSMPYDFQNKYSILELLSDNKFLHDDTVRLVELTDRVHSTMSKGSYATGLTADIEVELRLNDNISFLYENCLWFSEFFTFKQYIRNSLLLLFEKANYDNTRDLDIVGYSMGFDRDNFHISYYDFLNVAKTFSVDDIKHLERKYNFENFKFIDTDKIESYLLRMADETNKLLSNNKVRIWGEYRPIIKEAKVAFYFAKYIKISTEGLIKIFNTILLHFPDDDLDIRDKYVWIKRLSQNPPDVLITVIEDFLIQKVNTLKEGHCFWYSKDKNIITYFGNLIRDYKPGYISKRLSEHLVGKPEHSDIQIDFIYQLYRLLSKEAKEKILVLRPILELNGFMNALEVGAVKSISDGQELILEYLEKQIQKKFLEREEGVISDGVNIYYFPVFGIWYFLGELNDLRMKNYRGLNEEYDMFLEPESFDYNSFEPRWLKTYSDKLLEKMSQNKFMRPHIVENLKECILNTNDKNYIEIFLRYFAS